MKVLMLVNSLNIGGTETSILSLAKALQTNGIRVGIASRGGPLTGTFRSSRIEVHLIPASPAVSPAAWVKRIAEAHRYDIVHAHDSPSYAWIAGMPAGAGTPVPVRIMTLHGTYHNRKTMAAGFRCAKAVIAVSPQLISWARRLGAPREKLVLVPNGIETSRFHPHHGLTLPGAMLPAGQRYPVIGYVGRFQAPKHRIALHLIRAADRYARQFPNSLTVLAGPGVYLPVLRKAAQAVNRKHGRTVVQVRQAMSDPRLLYGSSDVVVGTGRVALEAMACGKPVLAAGASGYFGPVTPASMNRAIRLHFGDHGATAPVTPVRLAAGVAEMERNLPFYAAGTNRIRMTVVQRFSIASVVRRMIAVYRRFAV
jgi:glycosyltransferase involved in cell wall biosynthesis